jgi:multiple antibiotic resistance protein
VEFIKLLMALVVLVNPLGAMSVFISLTAHHQPFERRRIAQTTSISVAVVVGVSALIGDPLLRFLGISIGAFQMGGGLLMLLIAIAMMNAQPMPTKANSSEQEEASSRPNIAVVPLAIPIMTGPGTISTVIIYGAKSQTIWDLLMLISVGAVLASLCYAALISALPISRWLGVTGVNIVNRVMGMILSAISVEIMADGLRNLFPQLIR